MSITLRDERVPAAIVCPCRDSVSLLRWHVFARIACPCRHGVSLARQGLCPDGTACPCRRWMLYRDVV